MHRFVLNYKLADTLPSLSIYSTTFTFNYRFVEYILIAKSVDVGVARKKRYQCHSSSKVKVILLKV